MTKTRRSLMVLLFMSMVLGVGLLLPGGVIKPVKAQQFPKVEIRSSDYLSWSSLNKPSPSYNSNGLFLGYFSYSEGFLGVKFSWVTIAVTVPKPTPGMRGSMARGTFTAPSMYQPASGQVPPIFEFFLRSPSFSSETSTHKTYYYRISNGYYYTKGTIFFSFDSGTGEFYNYRVVTT